MTKDRDDYIARIQTNLNFKDAVSDVSAAEIVSCLDTAIDWYSRDRPYELVHSITGDGGNRYTLPSDWDTDFSSIVYVEFPAGEDDPTLLDEEEVFVWTNASTTAFQFRFRDLTTSDTALVKYTRKHSITSTACTVPDTDFDAVCFLATAHAALAIAGRLIRNKNESGMMDGLVSLRTTSDQYKSYAQEMLKMYFRRLGINPDQGVKARLAIFDLDPMPSSWGFPWLTHIDR